jgi:hypothetical protein
MESRWSVRVAGIVFGGASALAVAALACDPIFGTSYEIATAEPVEAEQPVPVEGVATLDVFRIDKVTGESETVAVDALVVRYYDADGELITLHAFERQ